MAISHAFSNAISDGTNTNIVRPSDWNSAHNQYYTLSGNTLGASTVSGTNVVFQGSGNVSLSGTGSTIIVYGTGGGGGGGGVAIGASSQTATSGTVNFVNSNGISFGMSGSSQITASHNGITTQTVQTQASGNIAGTGFSSTTTAGTAITAALGTNGLTMAIPAYLTAAVGGGGVAIGASSQTATSGTVNFVNSNGITFGMSGSNQITASYTTSPVSNVTAGNNISLSTAGSTLTINAQAVAAAAGGQTATSGTINFANSNGITFGMSGSSQITASYTVPTSYVSNVNGSSGQISLNVGSSLSASTNGSSITFGLASNISTYLQTTGNYLTTARASNDAVGLNTAGTNVTWTVNSSGISLNAGGYAGTNTSANNASITLNSNGLTISVAPPGGGGVMYANLSGNTSGNTTASGSTLNFSGINLTLSGTNNSQIAISAPATSSLVAGANITISTAGSTISIIGGAGGGGVALGASTQTATSGTVVFANSNGITFGMAGSSQVTASFSQSVQTQASGNIAGTGFTSATTAGTVITGALGTNGLNLGVPAYLTTQSVQTQASGNIAGTGFTSATTAGTVITGALGTNGLNLGVPAYITTAAQSSLSNLSIAVAATNNTGGGTATLASSISFSNANGLTFYTSAGNAIVASYTVPTQSVQTQAAGNIAGTGFTSATTAGTAITAALGTNGLNMGIPAYLTAAAGAGNAIGITNGPSSGTAAAGTVYFNTSPGMTFGFDAASTQITAAWGLIVTAGTTNANPVRQLSFSNVNGVSFGLSTGAGAIHTITASVAPQYTLSGYNHYNDVVQSIGAVGQGSLIFDHVDLANAVQFDRFGLMMFNSNSSNSSGSHTVSFWIGLYTQNVNTISLLQSTSTTIAATHSGTAGSYSLFSGVRQLTVPFTTTLTQGEYFLGVVSSTSSAGANGSYSQLQQSNLNSDYRGLWGQAVSATNQVFAGVGLYTVATAGLPGSVAFSQINGTAAAAFRPPVVIFQSGIN